MREVDLPSGAKLMITPAPFADARALYQAILREMRDTPVNSKTEVASLYKDLFCIGFSSPDIEKWLWKCFEKCLYNDGKGQARITEQTFEPVAARDDYMTVCVEVAKENVLPFGKSLYAEYQRLSAEMTAGTQA